MQFINIVLFLIGIVLVITGHGINGALGLATMLLGLAALISMIYVYNRKYR